MAGSKSEPRVFFQRADNVALLAGADEVFGLLKRSVDETARELGADGVLAFGREGGDDALEGFGAGAGVNGGEDEVSGFGGVQGESHRFRVAHFSDHDHIGIFTKRVDEGLFEAGGIPADFTLANVGVRWTKVVFDWAFNGEDMSRFLEVDLLNQRGQGRRFSGARWAGDQDEAVRFLNQLPQIGV